ncbi:MAG: Aspartyl/glutamyl-tRNA(Asn/Gln) amidotransferase subunit B [Parcubacteria group bacterium GW2011_GWC1_41_7]|nr:MAG: Aspartyl/glutamyl-tRNA(Asn/Gln) amidotransferase subunit B [Parcubacteria group bacterium GW2011_GWC1_41_7]
MKQHGVFPSVGLEIHLELKTNTKMFCGCGNDSSEMHPNVHICEVCTGQPGTLPVLNKQAVISALKLIKALDGHVEEVSSFERKNYFYPDLPKGYQISQYEIPIGSSGGLNIVLSDKELGTSKRVRLRRIHMEEDTGRLVHTQTGESLVDFNRSGRPLLEIVTEPDMHTADEAKAFAQELILLIRYLGVSDANPEKGEIRLEANISVSETEGELGTKVEVKNLNSLRALHGSIEYEIKRHAKALKDKEKLVQETRGWDEGKQRTFSQRTKEHAQDYRYFPEPDLPPLILNKDIIGEAHLPELPAHKRTRFQNEFNLSYTESDQLVNNKEVASFFEEAVSEFKDAGGSDVRLLFNYAVNDLVGLLAKYEKIFVDIQLSPHVFAHLITRLEKGEFTSKIVKNILIEAVERAENVEVLMNSRNKVSDEGELKNIIEEVLQKNEKAVTDYKKGKQASFEFLIGQVMAHTRGRADSDVVRSLLQTFLS